MTKKIKKTAHLRIFSNIPTLVVSAVVLLLLIAVVIYIFIYPGLNSSAEYSSTTQSILSKVNQSAHDLETEQDLVLIAKTIDKAINEDNGKLPNNLSKLNLSGLHYALSNYSYKNVTDTEFNPTTASFGDWGYNICANFTSDTFTQLQGKLKNNYLSNSDNTGTSLIDYVFHKAGQQCFNNSYSYEEDGSNIASSDVLINAGNNTFHLLNGASEMQMSATSSLTGSSSTSSTADSTSN